MADHTGCAVENFEMYVPGSVYDFGGAEGLDWAGVETEGLDGPAARDELVRSAIMQIADGLRCDSVSIEAAPWPPVPAEISVRTLQEH